MKLKSSTALWKLSVDGAPHSALRRECVRALIRLRKIAADLTATWYEDSHRGS